MDPFTMARRLVPGADLTAEQRAQLRALNTKYFRELAALEPPRAREATETELAALDARIASDIRAMLSDEQRAEFDGNVARLGGRLTGGRPKGRT